jgi:hypothetical protein
MTLVPTAVTLFTCGEAATISSFEIEIHDACNNLVPPANPVNFEAFRTKNGSCTGLSGFGVVTTTWTTPESATIAYQSPPAGPYDADRMAGNTDHIAVRITDDFSGAFNCGSPLTILELETFPEKITNFDPLNNPISTTDHTDCNAAGMKSTDSTFNIEDACGNLVYDLNQLTLTAGAYVRADFSHDPSGVFNNPDDQGSIDPGNINWATITTAAYPSGDYTVTYTEPSCTLPPLYTKILHPNIALTANNFKSPVVPISFGLDLHSCTDCEIVTTTPTMIDCMPSDPTAKVIDVPGVTIVFCGITDGTPVELEVTSSAGAAGNASFDNIDPNVSTISGTFTSDTFSVSLYPGNAPNAANFTLTAYSPSKATYLTDPSGFSCQAVDLITIQSLCQSIKTYNEIIHAGSIETMVINANENLYIEVDDCNQNKDSTALDTITVTVTSPQGYTPPAPDIETVILTETAIDSGIFNSNVYAGATLDAGPLPIIYCGLGTSGDVSQNGRLFVRPGFDVMLQYTDPDDPADNGCVKYMPVNVYSCPAFVYSYFAHSYIHLDRHGVAADLSLGGNIFTNGEFELSGDMNVDGRGLDGVIHTPDDYITASLGHMSIAGNVVGDCYAPSLDLYGPDGNGQNTQVFPPNEGNILGDVYLMDGFKFDEALGVYFLEEIGTRGTPPSYGNYLSIAATAMYMPPPGSGVITYPKMGLMTHTGAVFPMPSEPGYPFDPNVDESYTLPPPDGKVLLAKDLPVFDYTKSVKKSQDMTTRYHSSIGEDTYFLSMAEFEAFLKAPRTYSALDGTTYTSPHVNAQGKTIYIIGDPYEGTIFHFPNGFETILLTMDKNKQVIIHGAVVSETIASIRGNKQDPTVNDGGFAIYSCGDRPVDWIEGWTGNTYSDYADWIAVRGGEEPIPYAMPSIVCRTRSEVKDRNGHSVIKGIVYSEMESHFHCAAPEGKNFLHGAQIANVVHNCMYMDFEYNDCVRKAAVDWYGCFCDAGGAPVPCQIVVTPSTSTVTKGGFTVALTPTGSFSGAYTYSVAGSSGGSVDPVTGVYTSGPNAGVDIVTFSSLGCLDATATINVIDACQVTNDPSAVTVPLGGSYVLAASSPQGGPFNWSFIQNQSGGVLDNIIGDSVTYTAGAGGGVDIVQVTDDGGCASDTTTINIDTCAVLVEIYEFNGAVCTGTPVDNVTAGEEVCVSALLGDPDSLGFTWSSSDPAGLFYDEATLTWVGSGVLLSQLGDMIRYKSGLALGTYSITSLDDESCPGGHFLSTCAITVAPVDPADDEIYATEVVDYVGWIGPATPARTIAAWSINDPGGIITVTSTTNATYTPSGVPGVYTISIEDNVGCRAETTVTVNPCPLITVIPPDPTVSLFTGNTETFSTADGTPPYTWNTSDSNIGVFDDPASGVFRPVAVWAVPINIYVVDDAGCPGETTALVTCPVLNIEPADFLATLLTPPINYTATGFFGADTFEWKSSDETVATIAKTGGSSAVATVMGKGITTITATSTFGCEVTTTLAVECPVITITPTDQTLKNAGDTVDFDVAGGGGPYTWASSDPAVGTIDVNTGVFTAVADGTATVTVTDTATSCEVSTTAKVAICVENIVVSMFEVTCTKRKIDVRAISDTQSGGPPLPGLTFAIFDGIGMQVWPAAGTQAMTWTSMGGGQYLFAQEDLGDFSMWDLTYYVEVYSSDCAGAPPGKLGITKKNCP